MAKITDPEAVNQLIARNVTWSRRLNGYSVETLATVAGMSKRTLDRREHGKSAWTTNELVKIADALGVSIHDLIPADA